MPAELPASLRFAAVDVGSNAVRLLLSRVFTGESVHVFKKESLVRMPLRLGEEVFTSDFISADKKKQLIGTMIGFRHLMEAYGALDHLACATSAMREARNGQEVADEVRAASGIALEIIDGGREAEIICLGRPEGWLNPDEVYLFIDVGGGSTEITLFAGLEKVTACSFDIGGIRILEDLVPKGRWDDMKTWVRETTMPYRPVISIGSGGNINKIFRLARKKEGARISYKALRDMYAYLSSFTLEERVRLLGLRPDRADVIIPASEIYLSIMKWAKSKSMRVPMVGLSDGLIHILFERHLRGGPAADPDSAGTPGASLSIDSAA